MVPPLLCSRIAPSDWILWRSLQIDPRSAPHFYQEFIANTILPGYISSMTSHTASAPRPFVAFRASEMLACGDLETVLEAVHALGPKLAKTCLVFDETTGEQIDFDLRGNFATVLARLATHPALAPAPKIEPAGPGRPRLGVACREVCLLPAHWDWLSRQSGGPSAALRRLVHSAMREDPTPGLPDSAKTALDRILVAVAGNLPGYEEASRALWSPTPESLSALITTWPPSLAHWIRSRLTNPPAP